jgi:hypothetical protein
VEKHRRNTSTTGHVQILHPVTVEGAVVVQAISTPIKPATVNNVKVSVFEHISLYNVPISKHSNWLGVLSIQNNEVRYARNTSPIYNM